MSRILLCLHGWGGSKESFTELREALIDTNIEMLTPDLPGFGDEPEPDEPMTVGDYADWVIRKYKDRLRGDWELLGHSHGGRIAIALMTKKLKEHGCTQPVHAYLCASAGIHRPRHLKRVIGLTLAKGGKALLSLPLLRSLQPIGKKLLYRLVRVHDYEKASDVMRKTLIKVSQEDLRPHLKDIAVPTDLFWGTDDGMTPYEDGKIMEREIPNAVLHSFKGVRHRVHRDRAGAIANVICSSKDPA